LSKSVIEEFSTVIFWSNKLCRLLIAHKFAPKQQNGYKYNNTNVTNKTTQLLQTKAKAINSSGAAPKNREMAAPWTINPNVDESDAATALQRTT
jgi:hypothetical protein